MERIQSDSGWGDNGGLLFTDDQEIGSRDERLANELYTPALVTARLFFFRRLQRLLTVHSRPRGPVHHVFLDTGEGGGEARRGEAIPEVDSRGRAPFDTGKERKCQIRGSAAVRRGFVRNRGRGDDDSTPSPFALLLFFSSPSPIIDNHPISRAWWIIQRWFRWSQRTKCEYANPCEDEFLCVCDFETWIWDGIDFVILEFGLVSGSGNRILDEIFRWSFNNCSYSCNVHFCQERKLQKREGGKQVERIIIIIKIGDQLFPRITVFFSKLCIIIELNVIVDRKQFFSFFIYLFIFFPSISNTLLILWIL